MTPEQFSILRYFWTGGDQPIPRTLRHSAGWAKRKGFLRNIKCTAGIANTIGGVQWLHALTDAGRAAYEKEEGGR